MKKIILFTITIFLLILGLGGWVGISLGETGESVDAGVEVAMPAQPGQKDAGTLNEIRGEMKIDAAVQEARSLGVKKIEKISVPEDEKEKDRTPKEIIVGLLDEQALQKKIDIDLDDTDLSEVLLMMAETGRLNIVLDPSLKTKKLDLHLKQVSVDEVLLLVASAYDLGFERVGQALYVTRNDVVKEKNQVSVVIPLKNINVMEAEAILKDLDVKVNKSETINTLVVSGEPVELVRVEKILKKIDREQPQVIIEAKVIEVNKDALREIGVDWSDDATFSFQESGRPRTLAVTENAPESPIEFFSIARTPLQLETVIKMLETQNKAKVLSNPRITTINNREGEIFVGDKIPYTITNVTGGVATTDVHWVEPGIRLKITPSIIQDDFVVLKVEPEVSFIYAFLGPNDQYPQVKSREATAYLRVKNHQPFVLGGLLNQEEKKNLYKVPLLGSIPLLGNLFKYEKQSVLNTELIITIIPTIVNGGVDN